MAEKKDSPPSFTYGAVELLIIFFIFLGLSGTIISWANQHKSALISFYNASIFNLINLYARYVIFSIFISITLFVLVIIYSIREEKIRQKIMSRVLPSGGEIKNKLDDIIMVNPKWKLVEEHINSDDANKWKLAILEADIILNELLDSLNLQGNSIGERLKSVETSDFDHIEEAWEAHKIRNAIAHEGSDFLLTQREARRIIKLYESVFREFEII